MHIPRALKLLLFSVISLSATAQTALAASAVTTLNGMLLIDPGVSAPQLFTKKNGKVVTRQRYAGGSYFAMNANNPNSSNSAYLAPGIAGGIKLGTYQNYVLNPNVPHPKGWKGAGKGSAGGGYKGAPVQESTAFSPFTFFGMSTYIGLNPIGYQSGQTHSAPSVNVSSCVSNTCSISADFSAWEVYWNGSSFEQGPRPVNSGPFGLASGSYDLLSKKYSLDWSSQINGGAFNGVLGYWHIEGSVAPVPSAVPVPAAIWLFASGLLGLIGITGRRKQA